VRITKIENQKRRPGRKNIYVDGEFLAGVSGETLLRLALRAGDELGAEQIKVLKKTEELVSARNVALRYLATRPRTVREVRDKLRDREFSDAEIARVIEELKHSGLLDDEEFARLYIRNALTLKPSGELLLRRRLLLLGVEKQIVERALCDTIRTGDRVEQASRAAETFLKRSAKARGGESPEKMRQRLSTYLARRGFSWDAIEEILKKTSRTANTAGDE
jgi:regulatory protein